MESSVQWVGVRPIYAIKNRRPRQQTKISRRHLHLATRNGKLGVRQNCRRSEPHLQRNSTRKQKREEEESLKFELQNFREQRSSPRVPVVATIVGLDTRTGRKALGVCLDISNGGLCLECNPGITLRKGGQISIEVQPLSLAKISPFRTTASVKWTCDQEAGLQFTDMSKELQKLLDQYLTSKYWRF